MAAAWAVHCDLQRFAPPGSSQCVYFFHRNGCQLLRIFQVDCRLLPAELRTDLGRIYGNFCPHELRHDEKNHINVYTTGSGDGLFISGGKYISIKWTKDGVDEPLHLFREDGSPLLLNCGTTFVNIMSPDTMAAMTIE